MNLDPGLSDTRRKDFMTTPLPKVPDRNMNKYRIKFARSSFRYGLRNDS